MGHDGQQPKKRLILGVVSLVVGFLAATFALFNWIERTGLSYLLANYARYVCAYGGFGAMIFGAMLVNDFLVRREFLKRSRSEVETKTLDEVKEKEATHPAVSRRPRKKAAKTARNAQRNLQKQEA